MMFMAIVLTYFKKISRKFLKLLSSYFIIVIIIVIIIIIVKANNATCH